MENYIKKDNEKLFDEIAQLRKKVHECEHELKTIRHELSIDSSMDIIAEIRKLQRDLEDARAEIAFEALLADEAADFGR